MKTETSKTKILFRSILLLPLLALLLFSFSTREVIEKERESVIMEMIQENATKAQMKTYNALARKYNAMSKENRIVKREDLVTMEYIYGIMSKSQKAKAEPFPDCIPPPPPPPPPAPDGNKPPPPPPPSVKDAHKVDGQLVEIIEVDPSITPNVIIVDRVSSPKIASQVIDLIEVTPGNVTVRPSSINTVEVLKLTNGERTYIVAPTDNQPATATTIIRESNGNFVEIEVMENQDYLKMMDSKKAIFYYEGKKISLKKANKIINKNPNISIRTLDQHSDQPIIKLEKSRIIIDRQ